MTAQLPSNGPISRILLNSSSYNDQTFIEDENSSLRIITKKSKGTVWSQSLESIYKFVQYDVIGPSDTALSVNKTLQYTVLLPPDNNVSVNKSVQYVVLLPPDNRVSVNKSVQYVILEALAPLPASRTASKFSNFFQQRSSARNRRGLSIPSGKRIYVFMT